MPLRRLRELETLKRKILSQSNLVENQINDATQAFIGNNTEKAGMVIKTDIKVDTQEVAIEEECLKFIALYQPVAHDLRFVVTILKINNDLERIGDLATNIAGRVTNLNANTKHCDISDILITMVEVSREMFRKSIMALIDSDEKMANTVLDTDNTVDNENRKAFDIFNKNAVENPQDIPQLLNQLSVSRHLERIADLACNIAEDVIYLLNGNIVRHSHKAAK